ncbi:MAG: S41 family peptidase [Verrucomicrobia bacterium]|nr:S41 family peptidase [Verrucomicrobiota bacterium]
MKIQSLSLLLSACLLAALPQRSGAIDLLERYPTSLTAGDLSADRAREWEFTEADLFHLSRLQLAWGKSIKLDTGPADLGVGHCADGAVWAVVIPRESGMVFWGVTNRESVTRVWLRFHPSDINDLFPPETVSAATDVSTNLAAEIRSIADAKITKSYRVGTRVLIPEPGEPYMLVNEWSQSFSVRRSRPPPVFTPELAADAFDQLWQVFDRNYAMFGLRPEVDWNKSREQFRPRALASKSTSEFANICAEMLKPLRDLHVSLRVGDTKVPVFDRLPAINSNPSAHRALLGQLRGEFPVQWAVTPDRIGFIETRNWLPGKKISEQCDEALEVMRDTRALIVDVRMNLGGYEDLAGEFAGRFLAKEFAYAAHQLRNGPAHTDFSEKLWRTVKPRGPWRYDRPVLLLIGERCISSSESFVAMMAGATNVTTMGAPTAGSSGNPMQIKLPLDMTVSVPVWITYLPDGTTPLDERGYQPQIKFEPQPGAFEGNRDDLLAAALERLRQAPLPTKPIEAN